jgi:hypothetical protein
MRQELDIKIDELENIATIAELVVMVLAYERVLRKIGNWGREHEPSIWAREILQANRRRLDS